MSYFKLVQVGSSLPVLVITNACHAGKADRDAISGVHFWFGKLCACDLPDRCLLQQRKQQVKLNINHEANIWLLLHKMRKKKKSVVDSITMFYFQTWKPERVISIKGFQSLKFLLSCKTTFRLEMPPSSAAWVIIIAIPLRVTYLEKFLQKTYCKRCFFTYDFI